MGAVGEHPNQAFRSAFSADACRAMVSPQTLARGHLYAEEGRVRCRSITADEIVAAVSGTVPYDVRLSLAGGSITTACTCPIGQLGEVCKHVVAVALVSTASIAEAGSENELDAVRTHLLTLERERLVELLVNAAASDRFLAERLRLDAARAGAGGPDLDAALATYRRTIDSALRVRDFISYRDMPAYARRAQTVVESLRDLLDDHPAAVVELADRALTLLEKAVGHVDDSDGHLVPLAAQMSGLHVRACERAAVDPRKLAATLFARETGDDDELEAFYGAARTYRHALGDAGLAEYRRRATAAWEQLPALRAGGHALSFEHRRFRLAHVMETLAELSRDVDEHVAVLAKNQSSPWQFIRIVEVLCAAGRFDDALRWAERGIAAFGARADSRLVNALADEYHRAGRGSDAVDLLWRAFDDDPDAEGYRRLQLHATRAGAWPGIRPRAIGRLDRAVTDGIAEVETTSVWSTPPRPYRTRADASPLVEVLLWDGDADAAWSEASRRGCSTALWLRLAQAREADHPLDAVPIWQAEVERLIDAKRRDTYAAAASLIGHVVDLLIAGGRADDAPAYIDGLRQRHRAKRTFMALLGPRGG